MFHVPPPPFGLGRHVKVKQHEIPLSEWIAIHNCPRECVSVYLCVC